MKVSISYCPGEEEKAAEIMAAVKKILPDGRVRSGVPKPPFDHLFITTPRPETE